MQISNDERIVLKSLEAVTDILRHQGHETEMAEFPMSYEDGLALNSDVEHHFKLHLFGFPCLVKYDRDYTGERCVKIAVNPPKSWQECPDTVRGLPRKSEEADMLFIRTHTTDKTKAGLFSVRGSNGMRDKILAF